MDADLLRELQDRGRFFYERFPGASAADDWSRERDRTEHEHAAHQRRDGSSQGQDEVLPGETGSMHPAA
jgi:hypothetical protein